MFRSAVSYVIALLMTATLAGGCQERHEKLTLEFFAMGGIPVHVTGWDVEQETFTHHVDSYRKEIQRLEAAMSRYNSQSVISRANKAGGRPVELDAHTAIVVGAALKLAVDTGGAFDPTVGPLLELWKSAEKSGKVPGTAAIERALQRVGHDRVKVERTGEVVNLQLEPGTALDLGGVAKGYFADVGVAWLRKVGLKRGLVELGGDLVAFDDGAKPQPFRVGVRHPLNKDELLGVVNITSGAVVTSGDYERSFEIGGEKFNHIIDPRTGHPCRGVRSVTIIAPTGAMADGIATGVLVLGAQKGLALVERTPGVETIMVVDNPDAPNGWSIGYSSGAEDMFELIKK